MEIILRIFNAATGQKTFYIAAPVSLSLSESALAAPFFRTQVDHMFRMEQQI